jgi:Cof subfamily protein (haloacid dehalogenase superfamily)|tara:strand:- start:638 stop:1498 length:861 start_codon:yes stop_codon:yes gene_type:complete
MMVVASAALLFAPAKVPSLIALDADGTLLTPQHTVNPAVSQAVLSAQEAGIPVILATGRARSGPWLDEVLRPLSLDGAGVFLQGLTAFDDASERIVDTRLQQSVLDNVQAACDTFGAVCSAYCGEQLLCVGSEEDARVRQYAQLGEAQPQCISATELRAHAEQINKLLVLSTKANNNALRTALEGATRWQPCRVITALDWTQEILPARWSKGKGLRQLLRCLDVPPSRVLAIGDGSNDLEMIRMVGTGIAMGNAGPQLKRAAKATVGTNKEDGVAQAIQKYALDLI